MNFTGRRPTKQELLDDYARHEPQEFIQFEAEVMGFIKGADKDGHQVGAFLSHELADISEMRVLIPAGISNRDAVTLLRKIADMLDIEGSLQSLYKALTLPGEEEDRKV